MVESDNVPDPESPLPAKRVLSRPALAAVAFLLLPAGVAAQNAPTPWPAVQIGARFGFDDNASSTVAGAQIRIPVVRGGWLELLPSGDVTFLAGLQEYQFNADAVYILGGGRGGLYLGGGLALRNTILEGPERETRSGVNAVVGLTSRRLGGAPFGTQIEIRWVFLDAEFNPRNLTLGVNFPLWGGGSRRGR